MDKVIIQKEMEELEKKIDYHFKDITWLSKAMKSEKIKIEGQGENGSEYSNEGLATIGDAILKLVIADKLYNVDNIQTKGEITTKKSSLENNATMHKVVISEGLIEYSYNDKHFYKEKDIPEHEKVVCKKHDSYLEAILGAVFYDSNFDKTRKWILDKILPLLEKYKVD